MQNYKKNIGSILAYGFLIFIVVYLVFNPDLLRPILEAPPHLIVMLAFIKVAQIIIGGLFTKITLSAFNKPISHKESAYIAILSSFGNYFGPLLGGFGVRAAYLKKNTALHLPTLWEPCTVTI